MCDTPGSSWEPPSSYDKLSLKADVSLLSLSQTISENLFGDRNLAPLEPPLMAADKGIFSMAER